MRIISHGDLQELGQICCPRCHCVFGYNKDDIEKYRLTDMPEYQVDTMVVTCPECYETISLPGVKE